MRVHTFIVLLALVFVSSCPISSARAAPIWPDVVAEGGAIEGHVYQADGVTPIQGAQVMVYVPNTSWHRDVVSGSDGYYTVTDLPTDTYAAKVDAGSWAYQYYRRKTTYSSASPISVTAPQVVSGIDFWLSPGGSITGHVYEEDGLTPIAGATLQAYGPDGRGVRGTTSEADGSYTMIGFPSATYRVKASAAGRATEYYAHKWWSWQADPIVVTAPNNTSGIDFALNYSGAISGRVTKSDGVTPISDTQVVVYLSDANAQGPEIQQAPSSEGYYTFSGLAAGEYKVLVETPQAIPGYVRTYYDQKSSWAVADRVAVAAGQTTSGVNFALGNAAAITGQVLARDGNTVITDAYIAVGMFGVSPGTHRFNRWVSQTDGTYLLVGLAPGSYKVMANPVPNPRYTSIYYPEEVAWDDAQLFNVAAGEVRPDVDFLLDPSGTISGTVSISSTFAAGLLLGPNATMVGTVTLFNDRLHQVRTSSLSTDGHYSFGSLPAGNYHLFAQADGYGGVYHGNVAESPQSVPVNVARGGATSGTDFLVQPEATIGGRVLQEDGATPLPGALVEAWPAAGGITHQASSSAQGDFVVHGLASGAYLVRASKPGYRTEHYNEAANVESATPVIVVQPNAVTGIAFTLEDWTIYLPAILRAQ